MNDFNPFEHDMADRLQRQARSVDIGDTPLTTVVARGRQRREQRRVVVGLAAVLALSATAIGTIQLLLFGVFGEYLGRIYEQSKNRPLFIIQDVVRSSGAPGRLTSITNGPSAICASPD